MTPILIGSVGLIVLILLLVVRVPIGVALVSVSLTGIWAIRGELPAITVLGNVPYDFISKWTLSAVPMFILMGAIAAHTGITRSLFNVGRLWLGRLPGGLAVATNAAGAGFAAATGSSLATTATMARIAVPEMLRLKYDPGLATGTAAAVGTLGALIPPSIIMVIYAVFAEISVGKMLLAGLVPGLLTAAAYAALIIGRSIINPALAPALPKGSVTWRERFLSLGGVWPVPVLVLGVVGGIYSGVVTATEAGAIGAALAVVIGFVQRTMNWTVAKDSLIESARTTAMIFFIVIGAALFVTFLSLSQMPATISDLVLSLTDNPLMIVLLAAAIYLILGCFLDSVGILLLTLPIFLPIFEAAQIHPIWVGVILVKFLEIGLLTPPVGLNVFVVKGVLGDQVRLGTIFKGVSWFLLAEAVVMTLLIAFPDIILFLPSLVE